MREWTWLFGEWFAEGQCVNQTMAHNKQLTLEEQTMKYLISVYFRPPFSLDFITAIDTALQSKFLSVLQLYRKQYQHSYDWYILAYAAFQNKLTGTSQHLSGFSCAKYWL